MLAPSPEDIAAALREDSRAYELPIGDASIGLDLESVLLRPFNPKTWAEVYDVSLRDDGDARIVALVSQVLWPAPAVLDDYATRFPELTGAIFKDLEAVGGRNTGGMPEIQMLTAATDPRVLARVKLPPAVASDLLAKCPGQRLAIVLCPVAKVAVVMRAIEGHPYHATLRAIKASAEAKEGLYATVVQLARTAVVWTPYASVDAMLDEFPCIAGDDLFAAFKRLGGGAAKRDRKSLR